MLDNELFCSIFFIESDPAKESFAPLTLCNFEAAAMHNPRHNVYVIHQSNKLKKIPAHLQRYIKLEGMKL